MQVWKPLLIVVPAGLLLGMAGGHWANPVMTQRTGDEAGQAMFQARGDRYGTTTAYPGEAEQPIAYVGGYSYPPYLMHDASGAAVYDSSPFAYSDIPLPTVAELDAKQAALLADPDVEFASKPQPAVEQAADAAQAVADQAQQMPGQAKEIAFAPSAPAAQLAPEPRSADGSLPAIW